MTNEKTQYLFNTYPEIFAGKDEPITQNLMAFGFECSDGWFEVINNLCSKIMEHCKINNISIPKALQVKEKYASLRFYVVSADDTVYNLIDNAEEQSEKTCEVCGVSGIKRNFSGWFQTLCNQCYKICQTK